MNETDTARPADVWPLPLHATALVLPLLLIGTGNALDPTFGGGAPTAYLDAVNAHRGLYLAAGLLLMAGMWSLVAMAAALLRLATASASPAFLRAGALLVGVWGVCGSAAVSLSFAAGQIAADLRATGSSDAATAAFTGMNGSVWATVAGTAAGIGWICGTLLAGVGLLRCGRAPRGGAIAVLACPIVMILAGALGWGWLSLIGLALAAAGLATAIPALLRSPRLIAAPSAPATIPVH